MMSSPNNWSNNEEGEICQFQSERLIAVAGPDYTLAAKQLYGGVRNWLEGVAVCRRTEHVTHLLS